MRGILKKLRSLYPEADCALRHSNPLQLLVATILSAQCTDVRVNMVTEKLFEKYRTAQDFARADLGALEQEIRSTGFYRNKARSIIQCCKALVENHGGQVPKTMDEMTVLAGVGRKTANVVLGTGYGIASGIVVDTHVKRISARLGLTKQTDPVKVEQDLLRVLPKKDWIWFSHALIWHGRRVCRAPQPLCGGCGLKMVCPYPDKTSRVA